jgi:hypothetical protein
VRLSQATGSSDPAIRSAASTIRRAILWSGPPERDSRSVSMTTWTAVLDDACERSTLIAAMLLSSDAGEPGGATAQRVRAVRGLLPIAPPAAIVAGSRDASIACCPGCG